MRRRAWGRRSQGAAGVAAGTVLLFAAAASADLVGERASLSERLRDGHIEVSESPTRRAGDVVGAKALAIVDAPFGRVLRVVADFGAYRRILPTLRASRVLATRGLEHRIFLEAAVPHVDNRWAEVDVRTDARDDGLHVIEARLRRGNVSALFARWEVAPTAGRVRTLVSLELLVDPDMPLPDALVSEGNKDAARNTINALRAYVRTARE